MRPSEIRVEVRERERERERDNRRSLGGGAREPEEHFPSNYKKKLKQITTGRGKAASIALWISF